MAKGKDFMRRNIRPQTSIIEMQRTITRTSILPTFGRVQATITGRETKKRFEDFKKTKPNAYALLCELFGKSAFKVFKDFDVDKLSEGKCLELLKFLAPVDDSSEERERFKQ